MTYPWRVTGAPLLERPQGALQAPEYFFYHWLKRLLERKIDIKVSFLCPWLPQGPLTAQWAPAAIWGPPGSWAPGRLGGPLVAGRPSRLGNPLESRWPGPPPWRNPGYVSDRKYSRDVSITVYVHINIYIYNSLGAKQQTCMMQKIFMIESTV